MFCIKLAEATIPESVKEIWDYVFSSCASLVSVVIPAGVTTIMGNRFTDCTVLTSVTLPDTVRVIDGDAFYGCKKLFPIIVGQKLICWPGASGEIAIPEGISEIGKSAFLGCRDLAAVAIPNSVTTIREGTPDIIVAVMQGKTPPEMTLAKAVNNLPEDWQEQREMFGF